MPSRPLLVRTWSVLCWHIPPHEEFTWCGNVYGQHETKSESRRSMRGSPRQYATKHLRTSPLFICADLQVLRQLTADAKRKRRDAEDREASLRARLAASERRAEASEREHRNHKLFTWGTVARETERAACRERCAM